MEVTELNSKLYQIDHENQRYLGLRIGPANSQMAKSALSKPMAPGAIFDAPQINPASYRDWNIIGIISHKDSVIAYGPWLDNAQFGSDILALRNAQSLDFVYNAARICHTLSEKSALPIRGLFIDGLIANAAGTIIMLPNHLQETILALLDVEAKFNEHEIVRIANLPLADSIAFGFLVLAFQQFTGSYPFSTAGHKTDTLSLINHGVCRSPRSYMPDIPNEIELFYKQCLVKHKFPAKPLLESAAIIETWRNATKAPIGTNLQPVNSAAENRFHGRERLQKIRRFLANNSLKIGFISVISILVISIPGAIIGNYLRPPKTMGMTSQQVIMNYYNSFNTLDTQMMEDASDRAVGASQKDYVTNIYVLTRIRFANEQQAVHLTPEMVKNLKDPALLENKLVFGLDQLTITKLDTIQKPQLQSFLVEYDIWAPDESRGTNQSRNSATEKPYAIRHHKDQVAIQLEERGNWRIKEIKTVE